jgi:Fic family protein
LLLTRADGHTQHFYSLSAQIQREQAGYYDILEKTQKDTMDITHWLSWFLATLQQAIAQAQLTLDAELVKANFWPRWSATSFNERQIKLLNCLQDRF